MPFNSPKSYSYHIGHYGHKWSEILNRSYKRVCLIMLIKTTYKIIMVCIRNQLDHIDRLLTLVIYSGNPFVKINFCCFSKQKTFKDQIEVSVSLNGRSLKAFIMHKFQLTCETIKLISNGKVLKDDVNLNAQDMKVSVFL
jgi:hypothetical protein